MSSYNNFSDSITQLRYAWKKGDGTPESWGEIAHRVATNVMSVVSVSADATREIERAIAERKFIPGGRFLAQAGRPYHQTSNCFLLRVEDSREGWGSVMNKAALMLMAGGGIGIDYSQLRPVGSALKKSGGTSSGMLPLAKTVNEIGRGVIAGGNRRSAIYGSLNWSHPDVLDFITAKNWPEYIKVQKDIDYDTPAPLDMTNISVILDKEFFAAYDNPAHSKHQWAHNVYWKVIDQMLVTAEPGFQIDYHNGRESLRNACSEIVSEDDSDVCVLGSVNLDAIESIDELSYVTELGQIFLLAGTQYTDRPTPEVKAVQEKNRRTGEGLMGISAWMAKRGKPYAADEELGQWLKVWKDVSRQTADTYADKWSFARPVAVRAIAPNGSISIAGGRTTSGLEPIFAVAYKRQFLTPDGWRYQYVVDPVAERLVEEGVDPDKIEDAYTLSMDVERRVSFQAWMQSQFVDNAISSTINLPKHGTPGNDDPKWFGEMLYTHLPNLRGVTCYPDGSRGAAQPIQAVPYREAIKKRGVVFEAKEECVSGVCGL